MRYASIISFDGEGSCSGRNRVMYMWPTSAETSAKTETSTTGESQAPYLPIRLFQKLCAVLTIGMTGSFREVATVATVHRFVQSGESILAAAVT